MWVVHKVIHDVIDFKFFNVLNFSFSKKTNIFANMENYNDDYKKGMKLLITECKKNGIDYHRLRWLIKFSKMLSSEGICYLFWYNAIRQNRLSNIRCARDVEDTLHGSGSLFIWGYTEQDHDFWRNRLESIFYPIRFISFNSTFWL